MPLTSPAYPIGPYRFVNREFLIITYRTDPQKLRELVPEPLEITDPLVKFEFIRMPDSTGFGDYTESGQVIPVSFQGPQGRLLALHVPRRPSADCRRTRAVGFPKKLANPTLHDEIDTLVGTLDYGSVRIATRHDGLQAQGRGSRCGHGVAAGAEFPAQDHSARRRHRPHLRAGRVPIDWMSALKGAWTGPAALTLVSHALAPLAELPVLEIVSGTHIIADLTLGLGKVVHDYLA